MHEKGILLGMTPFTVPGLLIEGSLVAHSLALGLPSRGVRVSAKLEAEHSPRSPLLGLGSGLGDSG